MNAEKLKKLQAEVRIGGKGTPRRKKKIVHSTPTDEKKLQASLKKLAMENITGIEELNIIKNDGTVIHFINPRIQSSLSHNTIAVSGENEMKLVSEMLPGILQDLGTHHVSKLKGMSQRLANSARAIRAVQDDDDLPDFVDDFDEVAVAAAAATDKKLELDMKYDLMPQLVEDFEQLNAAPVNDDKSELATAIDMKQPTTEDGAGAVDVDSKSYAADDESEQESDA